MRRQRTCSWCLTAIPTLISSDHHQQWRVSPRYCQCAGEASWNSTAIWVGFWWKQRVCRTRWGQWWHHKAEPLHIWKVDAWVKNGTQLCQAVHGVDVSADGDVVFTDRGSRVVRGLPEKCSGREVAVVSGSGADSSRDGSQPTAFVLTGKTIYVADTAVGAIKMASPTNSLGKSLGLLYTTCRTFGVHLRGDQAEVHIIEEAVTSLNEISTVFDGWVDEVQTKMGRKATTQGPRETVSAKSRWRVHILRDSLSSLGHFLKEVNPSFSKSVKLAATLTLVVENFFSQMRSRNDIMPTALEFAYLFGPTIRESLKQLTNTGFVYYTSLSSHYEPPDEKKFPFRDLPRISFPPSVAMTKEDQKLMRDCWDNFGKPVRQLTVKNQSTKDNVCTLQSIMSLHHSRPYSEPFGLFNDGQPDRWKHGGQSRHRGRT